MDNSHLARTCESELIIEADQQHIRAALLGNPCGPETDRPRTEHDNAISGLCSRNIHGIDRDRKRLGQCRDFQRKTVGNMVAVRCGNDNTISKPAIDVKADGATTLAMLRATGLACVAFAASHRRQHTIRSPSLNVVTPCPIARTIPENSCPIVTGIAAVMNS